jgi:hypothetical protein
MAELKTQRNKAGVLEFLKKNPNPEQLKDTLSLLKIFKTITGEKPAMWGSSIVGYGSYHYKSERSSQEGDWPLTGFSPRKQALSIYIMTGFKPYPDLMKKLGKYKTGSSCLYIKRLSDIDLVVLKKLISQSFRDMKKKFS